MEWEREGPDLEDDLSKVLKSITVCNLPLPLPSPLLIIDDVEMDWRLFLLSKRVRSFNLNQKKKKKKERERDSVLARKLNLGQKGSTWKANENSGLVIVHEQLLGTRQ